MANTVSFHTPTRGFLDILTMIPPSRLPRPKTQAPEVTTAAPQDEHASVVAAKDGDDEPSRAEDAIDTLLNEIASGMLHAADQLVDRLPLFIVTDEGRWKEATPEVRFTCLSIFTSLRRSNVLT